MKSPLYTLFLSVLAAIIIISGCTSQTPPTGQKNDSAYATENCTSHSTFACYNDSLYWYDSCGGLEGLKEYCQNGCENGTCIQQPLPNKTCTDSDGGKNYYVKGVIRKFSPYDNDFIESEDGCYQCSDYGGLWGCEIIPPNRSSVDEKYCDEEGIERATRYICPYPYVCRDGACRMDCVEEGRFGNLSLSQLNITCCEGLKSINNSYPALDSSCRPPDYGVFFCTKCGDGICGDEENRCNCPEDCKNQKCIDSDGGKNYSVRGDTKSGSVTKTDSCGCGEVCSNYTIYEVCRTSCTMVSEYYCLGDEIREEMYDCENGCESGACRKNCRDGEIRDRYDENSSPQCSFTNIWKECIDGQWVKHEQYVTGDHSCGGPA